MFHKALLLSISFNLISTHYGQATENIMHDVDSNPTTMSSSSVLNHNVEHEALQVRASAGVQAMMRPNWPVLAPLNISRNNIGDVLTEDETKITMR